MRNYFKMVQNAQLLSTGEAIWRILAQDPETVIKEDTPLFIKEETRKYFTYEDSWAWLKRSMWRVVIYQDWVSPHSLLLDGATAYANSPEVG